MQRKSAIVARINYKQDEQNRRRIIFHELMHIYCAKVEVDDAHFIDIYGNGDPLEKADSLFYNNLNIGYFLWSEFIANTMPL